MAFPIALAVSLGSSLLSGGRQQQQPSFQIPEFNPGLRRNYTSLLGIAPSGGAPAPELADNADQVKKGATKDFILQAFLGNLINSAFQPAQPAQTFSPPVFR